MRVVGTPGGRVNLWQYESMEVWQWQYGSMAVLNQKFSPYKSSHTVTWNHHQKIIASSEVGRRLWQPLQCVTLSGLLCKECLIGLFLLLIVDEEIYLLRFFFRCWCLARINQ